MEMGEKAPSYTDYLPNNKWTTYTWAFNKMTILGTSKKRYLLNRK